MTEAYCKYCNHTWKHKKEYEKHIACCEYFYHYRRNPVKEMDDYGNKLPTQQELFRFVQELSLKCSRLEQDVDRLKRNASVRNKKVITDCLNHPDEIPDCTFTEWWKRITLGIRYTPTEYETAEMVNHWSVIENPFLFRVFRRDLVDGIKYLMTQFLSVSIAKLPIRCFTQKANVFYVYDTLPKTDKSNDFPPMWRVMSSDDFETMIDGISQLFVREFLVWQRDNMESIDANEARKDEQMTYMMRVNGMRPSKERGMADIRKWLFSTLEKNVKVEFEFV